MEAGNKLISAIKYFNIDKDIKYKIVTNGVNSNVYILGENKFILKFYRTDKNNPTRLEREVHALKLFAENKISNVPYIIGTSLELNCTLMSFIEGASVNEMNSEFIDQFVLFYKKILSIPEHHKNNSFESIDSCQTLNKLYDQLYTRITNLENENNIQIIHILKIIKNHVSYLKSKINEKHYNDLKSEFSVVDFGINNVLLRGNNLYFIDFEFFGIDNPIHLISDTIAHPANNLSLDKQISLYEKFLNCHENKKQFSNAFNGTNLLFDLKWCLIMLNPFLSSYSLNVNEEEREKKKKLQLIKVINKIDLIEQKIKNEKFLHK